MAIWQAVREINNTIWKTVSSMPGKLDDGSVDVVIFSHSQTALIANQLRHILDDNEKYRAGRFYTEALQHQFIIRHAILRYCLSSYTQQDPHEIKFTYTDRGKPFLENRPVYFNLSHSLDLVLIAITKIPLIGIDIEFVKAIDDMERVAKHHFSPSEQATFFNLAPEQQTEAFYRCWTRKEAFIKADGRGLGLALDSFDVTLAPSEPAKLLSIRNHETTIDDWRLLDLSLATHYTGALLSSSQLLRINYYEINPDRVVSS